MAPVDVIKQGQNVILKKGKSLRLYQVYRKRKVHLDKKHFCLDEVIGKPYGATWDVRGHSVQMVCPPDSDGEDSAKGGGTDNRSLNDDKCSQKLSDEDIRELKTKGKHGEAIVEQLVENSSSFKEKTVYSQAKYLKRKRDKHVMQFQILRPTTLLLCEMYGTRAPSKNIHLRMDTLAQILGAANIQSGINVLMMETCQGLLLGAIMERMGGKGTVIQIHSEHEPVRLAVEAYNFPASVKDTLYSYPLDQLSQLASTESQERDGWEQDAAGTECSGLPSVQNDCSEPMNGKDGLATTGETEMSVGGSNETDQGDGSPLSGVKTEAVSSRGEEDPDMADCQEDRGDDEVAMETDCKSDKAAAAQEQKRTFPANPEKEARKQRRRQMLDGVRELLQTTEMDALVMASKFQPLPIFSALFRFLAPSRPFVVYCHYIEPLMECNDWLRDTGEGVNLRVTETWLREYQVLPERTHPVVNMSGTGGYLLTGTKVSNSNSD